MRLASLTLDEVNQNLAQAFADEHGVSLDVQARPEGIRDGNYDAVLFDPESFPPNEHPANLKAVLDCHPNRPIAIHGYGFSADQMHDLRQRGALVARRLDAEIFARLLSVVRAGWQRQTVA